MIHQDTELYKTPFPWTNYLNSTMNTTIDGVSVQENLQGVVIENYLDFAVLAVLVYDISVSSQPCFTSFDWSRNSYYTW